MKLVKIIFGAMLSSLLIVSCTSTTMLKSSPSGAKFYADGKYLGESPINYSNEKIIGSATLIEIKKEGYKNKTVSLFRNEKLNVGALVGGILLAPTLVGLAFFLWIMDYNPEHNYELEPLSKK